MKSPIVLRRFNISGFRLAVLTCAAFLSGAALEAAVIRVVPVEDSAFNRNNTGSPNSYINKGRGETLSASISNAGVGSGDWGLLRFELPELDPSQVVSITLNLTGALYNYSYAYNEVLRVYQVAAGNSGWVASGATEYEGATGAYRNQTSYTNTTTHAGVKWASGQSIFSYLYGDVGPQIGSLAFSAVSIGQVYSITLDKEEILKWTTDAALQAAGLTFHLFNDEPGDVARFMFFSSIRSPDAGLHPYLEITVIPEPSMAALFVLSGAGLFVWRRRRALA